MDFILIYVTHKNIRNAKEVVNKLMQKKLVASANFFPIHSSYWWKGKLENTSETVSILKTTKNNWKEIKSEIAKVHPYEVPCIIKMNAQANEEYVNWLKDIVK